MLALTDHDTTAGIAIAQQAVWQLAPALRFIAGVEISASWHNQVIHVVGLLINPDETNLQAGLREQRQRRDARAAAIAETLAKHGFPNAYQGTQILANGGAISRAHFARYLVLQGAARTSQAVFKRYLTPGKPGYVRVHWPKVAEAVAWIHGAGGIAVLAHPARYLVSHGQLKQLAGEFKALGGEGLEVVSGCHGREDMHRMAALARAQGLLASVGSDYHGKSRDWIELGRMPLLPAECEPIWTRFPPVV